MLIGALLFCRKEWSQFDIVDLYILFVGMYFGAYSLVKALLVDYSIYNPWIIIIVFSQIIVVLAIILIIWRQVPKAFRQALEIKQLLREWSKCNKYFIILSLAILIAIQAFGYVEYNIFSHVDHHRLSLIGRPLPYWFSSSLVFFNDFAFCIFIAVSAKIITTDGHVEKLWLIPLTILFLIASFYGRRSLISLVIIGTIIVFLSQGKELFKLKYFKILPILLLAIIMFSNLYQTYRAILQSQGQTNLLQYESQGRINPNHLKNPLRAAFDFTATLKNISYRTTAWEFNYLIFDLQSIEKVPLQLGRLSWQSLKNSIPKVFWPNKEIIPFINSIAKLYTIPYRDYEKNNFIFAQLEVGYFSIIVLPIFMVTLFILMGGTVIITRKHPILLLMLSGLVINYLINIEQNPDDVFILIRNMILCCCVYSLGYEGVKIIDLVRTSATKVRPSDSTFPPN